MRDVTILVQGMHCAACGLLVDDCILDVKGVAASITDSKSGVCRVTAEDTVSDAALLAAVAEAGYAGEIA